MQTPPLISGINRCMLVLPTQRCSYRFMQTPPLNSGINRFMFELLLLAPRTEDVPSAAA